MKTKILNSLKTKFEGVSDNVLARVADKLAKSVENEESIETAVSGVSFQNILESYGDSRATEAQATAIRNYEAKHRIKDGKPVEQPAEVEKPAETMPEWAKAIMEMNKALQAELTAIKSKETTSSRKARIAEQVQRLPENLRKAYSRVSIEGMDDTAFDTMLNEITAEIDGICKEQTAKSAIFGSPIARVDTGASSGDDATDQEAQSIVDRMNI